MKIGNVHIMKDSTFHAHQVEAATSGVVLGALATVAAFGLYEGAKALALVVTRALAKPANTNTAPTAQVEAEAAPGAAEATVANDAPAKKAKAA